MPAIPGFALKVILGQMADILLTGSRISNQKLLDAGFRFEFVSLQSALDEIIPEK